MADHADGLEYVPIDIDSISLLTKSETGWNKLAVRQCRDADHYDGEHITENGTLYTANGSKVQNLENRDLSNLFSTLLHVIVKDEPFPQEPGDDTPTVSIPAAKIWEDENNQDGIRPGQVIVRLFADGQDTAAPYNAGISDWLYSQ